MNHGHIDLAVEKFKESLVENPENVLSWTNLIYAMDLQEITWEQHQAIRREFGSKFPPFKPFTPRPRKLNIGYVSADFNHHSACAAFGPVIRHHNQSKYNIYMYSSVESPDDRTEDLARFGIMKHVRDMQVDQLDELIRSDSIDILVDLSGMSGGHRLITFSRKPAPIQITAWGYGGGTGLPSMDYHFTDPVFVPKEVRPLMVEKQWDLPCAITYAPPKVSTPVLRPPEMGNGYITFGNLGRYAKVTDQQLHDWAHILKAVPKSRIILKDIGWDNIAAKHRVWEIFEGHGVSSYRIDIHGRTSQTQHQLYYSGIDIVLDTFPHAGGITGFESVFMGCPVITRLGNQPGSRIGGSVLTSLGLQEWVTTTPEEYHHRAVALANNPSRRLTHRRAARDIIHNSESGNPAKYTIFVEMAYDEMWRHYALQER